MSKNERLTVPITVPLDQIRISERRRRGLSVSTVERYRQWLEQGREAPPVRLVRQGNGFVVQDGRHRVAAAHAAGQLEIDAEVSARTRLRARVMSTLCRLWGEVTARAAESFPPLGLPLEHQSATPSGTKLWWQSASLATRKCGFDSHRLHQRLRSVNGKHAPFVRPRCGFNSCRRLFETRPRDCPWNVSVTLADVAQ